MNENIPKWYVIHTYSGYENKVASSIQKVVENRKLQNLIEDIFIPMEKIIERYDNKKKEKEVKIYPGYVFVKMLLTDESWYIIRNTRGCTGFVGPGSKPIPLSDTEVEKMGINQENKQTKTKLKYNINDNVYVCNGPLTGFIGTVKKINIAKNKVYVLVSMFGRDTVAELELDQVAINK